MANEFLKAIGVLPKDDEESVMLQQPTEIPVSEPSRAPAAPLNVQQAIEPLLVPREANYQAPQISVPQAVDNSKAISDLDEKLLALQENYKKELADAEDRKFKSQIWAAAGNYLPGVVAGATAMNTKASVKPAEMQKVEASDPTGRVDKKYNTDYEGLIQRYKTLKDGQLTPKDMLYANIAQANLNMGANRLNSNIENTDRNAGLRGVSLIKKAEKDDELSDKQTGEISNYNMALSSLKRTRDMQKGVDTGPIAELRNRLAKKVGWDDPKVSTLRAQIVNDLSERVKQLSGTAASDRERAALAFTLPSLSDNEKTFESLLNLAEKRIQEAKSINEETIRTKQGKNVEGYGTPSPAPQAAPAGETVERNGKTYKWNPSVGKYQPIN